MTTKTTSFWDVLPFSQVPYNPKDENPTTHAELHGTVQKTVAFYEPVDTCAILARLQHDSGTTTKYYYYY